LHWRWLRAPRCSLINQPVTNRPYPQTALYNGPAGGENIAANWSCGAKLQAVGRRNPAACHPNSKVPPRR
jgi:hypothetical protein